MVVIVVNKKGFNPNHELEVEGAEEEEEEDSDIN
jgi:hypothetical protein